MRIFLLLAALATTLSAADTMPPPAKKVTVPREPMTPAAIVKTIKEQTGSDVDVSALQAAPIVVDIQSLEYWTALERLASATNSHLAIATVDGRVRLQPGKSLIKSCVTGPFRLSPRGVIIRGEPASGSSNYSLMLDCTWEPWLNVYRIDSIPKIDSVTDDMGKSLTVASGRDRPLTVGNWRELTIRPQGVVRATKSLSLKGSVVVTIAEKLLTFTFDAMSGKPTGDAVQEGVSARLTKFGADGNDWAVVVRIQYPKSDVVWESFEYGWQRNNVMRLLPPKGEPIVSDLVEAADLRYGFKGQAKQVGPGWKIDYRTPGPMREIVVPFELKDIQLP
jgi:hypothetical protein